MADLDWSLHKDSEDYLLEPLPDFVTVYQRSPGQSGINSRYAYWAPVEEKVQLLARTGWDYSFGDGRPELVGEDPEYSRYGWKSPRHPLVFHTNHPGHESSTQRLSEEFVLFHNLLPTEDGKKMLHVGEDGTETDAVLLSDLKVKVRRSLLVRFQAAIQKSLILCVHSMRYPDSREQVEAQFPRSERSGDHQFETWDSESSFDRYLTVFMGKRIIDPNPVESSGVWPFDRIEKYQDFIVGENSDGSERSRSCDPSKMSMRPTEPNQPSYSDSAFFDRKVLRKYYESHSSYDLGRDHVQFGGVWRLEFQHRNDSVCVMLEDLGKSLPERERDYWRGFNILAPSGGPEANLVVQEHRFKTELFKFQGIWREKKGWDLFRPLVDGDAHLIPSLRIPLDNSPSEFENQIGTLAKLLVDRLNKKQLEKEIGKQKNEGSLQVFKRWWLRNNPDRDLHPYNNLYRIYDLRSKLAAHSKSSDYRNTFRKHEVDEDLQKEISTTFERLVLSFQLLRAGELR